MVTEIDSFLRGFNDLPTMYKLTWQTASLLHFIRVYRGILAGVLTRNISHCSLLGFVLGACHGTLLLRCGSCYVMTLVNLQLSMLVKSATESARFV